MKSTFILVADNVRARIFTAETPSSPLQEIEALAHTEVNSLPIRKNMKLTILHVALPNTWKKRTTKKNLNNY
ncbi:MAG: Host attachment protein [Methylococcaceae bacterium NSP1-1]|nr:MAG: Host attachment protein [Methylococcaceae bacterium NSP1-1]